MTSPIEMFLYGAWQASDWQVWNRNYRVILRTNVLGVSSIIWRRPGHGPVCVLRGKSSLAGMIGFCERFGGDFPLELVMPVGEAEIADLDELPEYPYWQKVEEWRMTDD